MGVDIGQRGVDRVWGFAGKELSSDANSTSEHRQESLRNRIDLNELYLGFALRSPLDPKL